MKTKDCILEPWRQKLFNSKAPEAFTNLLPKMKADKKESIGILRPWAWFVEPVRGCNLRCGFCATRLFPVGERHFMDLETWEQALKIISAVTPKCRIEFCNAGEPTLHPEFLRIISMARMAVPMAQILVYTNGLTLMSGKASYEGMFKAGLNMVFVDMYSDRNEHIRMARESGYEFFEKKNISKEGRQNVFSYRGNPNVHLIQLSEHPGDWSRQKKRSCGFSTFMNHLDWEAATKYGIMPVAKAPNRRCQQPFSYANICWDGEYVFCCFDFMRETAKILGNVAEGLNGFFQFWFGEYMQDVRRRLYLKDRTSHSMCSRCAFAANRCDIPRWAPELLDNWWDGKSWHDFRGLTVKEMEENITLSTGLGLPNPKIRKKSKGK